MKKLGTRKLDLIEIYDFLVFRVFSFHVVYYLYYEIRET
jgi:hypothetical protein